MALIKCKECGQEISTAAHACPHCGFQAPKTSGCALVAAWVVGIFVVLIVIASVTAPTKRPDTPEQTAQKQRDNERMRKALAAGIVVRSAMRNPDSLVWESIRANDDGSVLCFRYRAQNGFGGMNRETVAVINGLPTQAVSVWNKHCTKALADLIWIADEIKRISDRSR